MLLHIDALHKQMHRKGRPPFNLGPIDLRIDQGGIVGIIGPSGAGKSTLLRCLNLLETPTSGRIFFQDRDLCGLSFEELARVRQQMSFISQGYHLLSRRTVWENVILPLTLSHTSINKEDVMRILDEVGLTQHIDAYPAQLSGGQRQRVAIARALVTNPSLILCDEMTSALDPNTSHEILDLLVSINRTQRLTIIMVTHDMGVIKRVADYVCVLDKGQLVEYAPIADVLTAPRHRITQMLVKTIWDNQLPEFIVQQLQPTSTAGRDDIVLKLEFDSRSSTRPIVSSVVETFGIPLNILAGNIDHVGALTVGHLFVSLPYSSKEMKRIMQHLTAQNVRIETIGFIQWA